MRFGTSVNPCVSGYVTSYIRAVVTQLGDKTNLKFHIHMLLFILAAIINSRKYNYARSQQKV